MNKLIYLVKTDNTLIKSFHCSVEAYSFAEKEANRLRRCGFNSLASTVRVKKSNAI